MKKIMISVVLTVLFLTGCQKNYIKDGTKFLEEQNYTEAASSFQKAAENDKKAAEAYRGLGIVYYEQQDYQNAVTAFQKVVSQDGDPTPEFYNMFAISLMQTDDIQGALDEFGKGIKLAGDDEKYAELVQEMKFNEIVCCEKLTDWENAKAKVQEYITLYPDDKEAQKEAGFLNTR